MDRDHLLVGIWMNVKIKNYEIAKLMDKQVCKEFAECFQNIIKSRQL